MISIGQFVRAILAEGLAAALPSVEGFEAQLGREGVVIEIRPHKGTIVVEDYCGNEHVCHLDSAIVVDPVTLDAFYHGWVSQRAAQLTAKSP